MELPVVSWVDEIIKDAFKSVFDSISKSADDYVRSLDLFKQGRKKYFSHLRDRHGAVQILGMSEPIPLDRIYVTVTVNTIIQAKQYLDDNMTNVLDQRTLKKRLKNARTQTSVDPLDVMTEPRARCIVLGKPGCGKTTLLKNIALLYSGNNNLQHPKVSKYSALFPTIVVLRDFQHDETTLESHIINTMTNCGFPHAEAFLTRLLQSGKVIVLLDGLDEVEPKHEQRVCKNILDLTAKYPLASYVLSSRTAAYKGSMPGFTEVEIEDFSAPQRIEFIKHWFDKSPQRIKNLLLAFQNYPQLDELAESPLLLSLMCILYERELSLPSNRVELYDKCVRTMLVEWDASRGFRRVTKYENLSEQKKLRLLNYCAATLFSDRETIFTKRKLVNVVSKYLPKLGMDNDEAIGVVNELTSHHGILIPVGASTWCFSHLTLHEYFTACYIVDTRREDKLLQYAENVAWIEVFTTVAALLEDASDFIERILDQESNDEFYQIALAAHCASCDSVVSDEIMERIFELLCAALIYHSGIVHRVYETRLAIGSRRVLFFEAYSREAASTTDSIVDFLSALNCLVAVADQSTLSRLAASIKDKDRKTEKIVSSIQRAKSDGESFHVVSNALPKLGLTLPMQMTNFRERVYPHVA